MAKKPKTKEKASQKKSIRKEGKQRSALEKLGFTQLMFDFYTAPVL